MVINICHIWPDGMCWNGSGGNLVCLKKRLEWRGFEVKITDSPIGDEPDLGETDLVYIGSGKALENPALMADISRKAPALRIYASGGGAILAVCEGYELLGETVTDSEGTVHGGLRILPIHTEYAKERFTGNALMETESGQAVFFENHAGLVTAPESIRPWGTMLRGHGDNGRDGRAGVRMNAVFGCQAHGPLLPKNPALADEVLSAALSRRHPGTELKPLDDSAEDAAREVMLSRLSGE